jgi:pimeloyl-ACP methyl ester carboxylesterase
VSSSARSGASGLAGLVQSFSGALSAARNLLNYSTYYLMKERAGTVGRRGVNSVLRQLKAARPDLRIHLVGHSFGARLVTAAVDGPAGAAPTVFDSLVLLQGAFSHNSFGERFDGVRDGAFRGVITGGKIRGPIVITHSGNDRAVGLAYPLASRVAGQDASGIGDAADRFGALGRNGAQHAPERVEGVLQPVGAAYGFSRSKIYNLKADSIIEDHSDIFHPEVAYAMLSAVVSA